MSAAPLHLDIEGETWALEVPERWQSRFHVTFGHLVDPDATAATIRVSSRSPATESERCWANGLLKQLPEENGIAAIEHDFNRAHISRMSIDRFDLRTGVGESILLDPQLEETYLSANLLLRHFVWRALQRSLVPIHAAAVGGDGGFWLIPAAAGQGKSTITAAAVGGGLKVLADDFVLFDPQENMLLSLYGTIRLAPSAWRLVVEHFGERSLSIIAAREDEKLLLVPGPTVEPGAFPRRGRLNGILLLNRTGRSRLADVAPPARALRAFSSSLRLLPSLGFPAALAFRYFAALTETVESRVLETGPDLLELVRCLRTHVNGEA